jgi:2-polyprenyl-6-hydroxyphenyl methylase/3-demethylubiquinone-9 3-methyltransferase
MDAASLDPEETAKFDRLAARWWDRAGPFAELHRMNPARLTFLRERAMRAFGTLSGVRTLDIGCGGGLVSAPLARLGAEVTAIDAGAEAIGAAKAYARDAGLAIRFAQATAEDQAAAEPGDYDLVVAMEIVEHVADLRAFMAAAEALLRPAGLLVVSTINRTVRARALALFAAENVLNLAPQGAHEFERLVRPDELAAAAPHLVWEPPVGISLNVGAREWRLSADVSMNYLRAATKPS